MFESKQAACLFISYSQKPTKQKKKKKKKIIQSWALYSEQRVANRVGKVSAAINNLLFYEKLMTKEFFISFCLRLKTIQFYGKEPKKYQKKLKMKTNIVCVCVFISMNLNRYEVKSSNKS